jgi:DNA-binding IclR family transcriptional regulator
MLPKPETKLQQAPAYSVPPVVRAIKVLRYIAAGRSVANQSQAAREIGINRTTLLRLLHTLEAEGMIEAKPGGNDYVLGNGMIELAAQKLSSLDVAQAAGPVLSALAERLGLSCHLGILDRREVLYVLRATPEVHLVSNVRIGTRLPAHASSMGRAILAHLSSEAVNDLFAGADLLAVTGQTPTTMPALHLELGRVRESSIVDSRSGFEQGIDSIAAPVFDHTGCVIAAINASGPESAFGGARGRRASIIMAVREAAALISRRLGYVRSASRALAQGQLPAKVVSQAQRR